MQQILIDKLRAFIAFNNPDLLLQLQQDQSLTTYLEDKVQATLSLATGYLEEGKPMYLVEELCVAAMTDDLKPSRYHYIRLVMEEEFPQSYKGLQEAGILIYEMSYLVGHCKEILDGFPFNESTESDRLLRYAIIGRLQEYLG